MRTRTGCDGRPQQRCQCSVRTDAVGRDGVVVVVCYVGEAKRPVGSTVTETGSFPVAKGDPEIGVRAPLEPMLNAETLLSPRVPTDASRPEGSPVTHWGRVPVGKGDRGTRGSAAFEPVLEADT